MKIVSLSGICNAENRIREHVYSDDVHQYETTICLIYDTDAFEYDKKPPIKAKKIERMVKEARLHRYFSIGITHNVEDMIVFSRREIIDYLDLPKNYTIDCAMSGLEQLKSMFRTAGNYYVKGAKCSDLLDVLNYEAIARKFCVTLKPLCNYFDFNCVGNKCKIKRNKK